MRERFYVVSVQLQILKKKTETITKKILKLSVNTKKPDKAEIQAKNYGKQTMHQMYR